MKIWHFFSIVVLAMAVSIGCTGSGQDGELPTNDPIVGKPADTSGKDPNARGPSGGDAGKGAGLLPSKGG